MNWPVDIVVPGHGEVGRKEDIQTMIDYIDMVSSMAGELKTLRKTPEDTNVADIPGPYRDWQFSTFFQTNLKFLYESAPE